MEKKMEWRQREKTRLNRQRLQMLANLLDKRQNRRRCVKGNKRGSENSVEGGIVQGGKPRFCPPLS